MNKEYYSQAKFMLTILPYINEATEFALKGGTALNFFYLELPRLSVDIDLTYLPIDERSKTLKNISDLLESLAKEIKEKIPDIQIQKSVLKSTAYVYKLIISKKNELVKIEPNLQLRGSCFPIEEKELSQQAVKRFRDC